MEKTTTTNNKKTIIEISLDKPIYKILEEYFKGVNLPAVMAGINEGRIFQALESQLGEEATKKLLMSVTHAYLFAGIMFAKKYPKLVHIKYGDAKSLEELMPINNPMGYVG